MRDIDVQSARVRTRRRVLTITPVELAVLAVRWATVVVIVAVWMLVAMIVGR